MYPKILGQEEFTGEIIHSHNYRHPEDFSGKRVVCLGAAYDAFAVVQGQAGIPV